MFHRHFVYRTRHLQTNTPLDKGEQSHMYDFNEIFKRNLYRFSIHRISEEGKQRAMNFRGNVVETKTKERQYQIDGGQANKRFNNGFAGEIALEEFLGVKFVDTTIGHSSKYR